MDQDQDLAQLTAVCVFVKTPGRSPIKTRLAAGIGAAAAMEFYRLSCAAVLATVRASGLSGYWAVAEPEALTEWSGMPTLAQGDGDLGERLATVYAAARRLAPRVLLIGGDAPQLAVADLQRAAAELTATPFVLGPALDGGFYLFGGARAVPATLWRSVPYSAPETAASLTAALTSLGAVRRLAARTDVDTVADLPALHRELAAQGGRGELLAAQRQLLAWLGAITETD